MSEVGEPRRRSGAVEPARDPTAAQRSPPTRPAISPPRRATPTAPAVDHRGLPARPAATGCAPGSVPTPRPGAEFWRAEDTVLQRDVAVTVLRRLAAEGGADRRRGRSDRRRPRRGDARAGAAAGQLRAPRLRPAARRARPRRLRHARRTCWAPPSPSGCPGAASPSRSPTADQARSPPPARSPRWPRPPRRPTGTASCWAATTRSGSGSTPDGRAADVLRAAAPGR